MTTAVANATPAHDSLSAGERAAANPLSHEIGTVWVCVPTYNEVDNVEPLAAAVLGVADGHGLDLRLLFIDDRSPDGTGAAVDRLAARDDRVRLLSRSKKQGLGPAYLHGFEVALENGADVIVQMDCDFSHDPAALPRLIGGSRVADMVIGSRYVVGGQVENWPRSRRLISQVGSMYARRVLGIRIRDVTGGFRCTRADALDRLLHAPFHASGYGFQIELNYRAFRAGLVIVEVPITFRDRTLGSSKMSAGIALEAARTTLTLPRRERELAAGRAA